MARACDILLLARQELGVAEDPPGSNHVKYNTAYYSQDIQGDAYAWCLVFIWWLFKQAGASDLFYGGKKTAYVPTIDYWARQNGLTVDEPRPGDIIVYDWNGNKQGNHVGICTAVAQTTVTTIEGNCDNAVKEMTRSRSQVLRVIRPKYERELVSSCDPETCPILARLRQLIEEV